MGFVRFSDWVLAKESSPATRLRNASALGLMPPIPPASINSHSTAPAWQQKKLLGKSRPKKKRKGGKKKNEDAPQNKAIDAFIKSVEELEKDLEILGKTKKRLDVEKVESKDKNEDKDKDKDKDKAQKNKQKEKDRGKDSEEEKSDGQSKEEEEKSDGQLKEKSKKQSEKKT
jgi:hypothetical protein